MTIFKYPLVLQDVNVLLLPSGAQVLTAQLQHGTIQLWALLKDTNAPPVSRRFEIHGTGSSTRGDNDSYDRTYIATVQSGLYVWHVFEVKP